MGATCADPLAGQDLPAEREMTEDVRRHLPLCAMMLMALVFAMLGLSPSVASAQGVDVFVDSTEITLESGDGDTQTAKVTLGNISDSPVSVQAAIPDDAGCTITPSPNSIKSGRR